MTDLSVNSIDETVTSITSSLLEQAKARDKSAWERLVHLYSPLVYQWCLRKELSKQDAADVGQEVFLAVARRLGEFRREAPADTFRGWLYTITKNKIVDFWRQKKDAPAGVGGSDAHEQLRQVPTAESDVEERSEADEIKILYRRVVEMIRNEFSEQDWQAFMQVVMEDQRAGDVAEDLGMTRNQVYLAKSRILHRVRERFSGEIE